MRTTNFLIKHSATEVLQLTGHKIKKREFYTVASHQIYNTDNNVWELNSITALSYFTNLLQIVPVKLRVLFVYVRQSVNKFIYKALE